MTAFTVLPAIDLRARQCVRLVQGDPAQSEVFAHDPVAVACRFVAEGARALHVVDLDGAFAGHPCQLDLVADIVRAAAVPVQFGGGLRRASDVDAAFASGVDRVVLGTRALDPAFFGGMLAKWGPKRIVAGLDARGAELAVAGWRERTGLDAGAVAARLRAAGAERAVYTQVQRDGMLAGPDLEGIGRIADRGLQVIASGGVTTAEDIRTLAAMHPRGVCGAILGRALYAGRVTLAEALAAAAFGGDNAGQGHGGL